MSTNRNNNHEEVLKQTLDDIKLKFTSNKDNIIFKKDYFKSLTSLLRYNNEISNIIFFKKYLNEIVKLKEYFSDSVLEQEVIWQIGKLLNKIIKSDEHDPNDLSEIMDMLLKFEIPKHSILFKFIFLNVYDLNIFDHKHLEILLNLKISKLPEELFKAIDDKGEKKPSVAEIILKNISGKIFELKKIKLLKLFIEDLIYVEDKYKNIPFTNYLISKSYFLINQNQKAEKILLKYLQKRSKDFLGWELYSLIVNDEIKKIQALCKSYISNIDESELVNIKIELIKLLIKNKYLSEAKSLSLKLPLSFRNKNVEIIDILKNDNIKLNKNIHGFCYEKSLPLLSNIFEEWRENIGIVYGVNRDKDLIQYVVSDKIHGVYKAFNLKKFKVGEFLSLKIQKVVGFKKIKYNVLHVVKSNKRPKRSIYKVSIDNLVFKNKKYYLGKVEIDHKVVRKNKFQINDKIKIKAIKLPKSNNSSSKWKVIDLNYQK